MRAWRFACCAWLCSVLLAAPLTAAPVTPPAPKSIRVVAPGNYPPYLFIGADGTPQGYEVDRWRLFEKHTGIHVDLEVVAWGVAKEDVLSGRADVIDLIYQNKTREEQYDFSAPYAELPLGIYVAAAGSDVHDLPSLRGQTVNVGLGGACANALAAQGGIRLHTFVEYEDAVRVAAVTAPHIFCMDENLAYYYQKQYGLQGRFRRAFVLDYGHFHMAVRKGNTAMLELIERGMASITPAEKAALTARWLKQTPVLSPWGRVAGIALGVVVVLAALVLLWAWMLRRSVAARTRELHEGQAKLRAIFDASPDAMWVKDLHGVYRECNGRVFEFLHLAPGKLIGRTDAELFGPEALVEVRARDAEVIRQGRQETSVLALELDGKRHQFEVINVPLRDAGGVIRYVLGAARDITERVRAESEQRLAAAAFETQEALLVMDADRVIQRINRAFTAATGHQPENTIGQRINMLRSRYHPDAFYESLWAQVAREALWQGELWIQAAQGEPRAMRMILSSVFDANGVVSHYVCSMVDLTDQREAHARVDRLIFFDPLTDLPNRHFLQVQLQRLLESADGGVLLLADLDHFKRINDLRGHATGDHLLVLVAQRLREALGERCMIGRFNGGTFAVLVPSVRDEPKRLEQACASAEQIREALREAFTLEGAAVVVTASIGWTVLMPGQGSFESVLKEAELAMYRAKAAGRDQVRCYEPAMQDELAHHEALVEGLRRAIDENALELHYQAQTDRHHRIVGAEALLRWTRDNGERVPPDVFIPIAEDNGLILPLSDWVLRQACAQLVAWAARPETCDLSLAVNVSARQFVQADFVEGVCRVLEASGANPARLKLEVTETVILGDIDDSAAKLAQLRARGMRTSLDDFGTGYSSLAYLTRLPLDQIKIDKSFVTRLAVDANDAMLAQTIITMGRGMGMEVIAEGVETEAQLHFLMVQGCDAFQGYLISRPVPLEQFEALLASHAGVATFPSGN